MSYKDWYTINADGENFICVAVDKDFEVQKQYSITLQSNDKSKISNCSCFAGHTWCRHKKILVEFRKRNLIGSRKYYNIDKDKWMSQPQQEA